MEHPLESSYVIGTVLYTPIVVHFILSHSLSGMHTKYISNANWHTELMVWPLMATVTCTRFESLNQMDQKLYYQTDSQLMIKNILDT